MTAYRSLSLQKREILNELFSAAGVTADEPLLQALLLHDTGFREAFCPIARKMCNLTASPSDSFVAVLRTLATQAGTKRRNQKL